MRLRVALLLLLAAFAVGAAACGGGDETSPTPETVEGTVGGETGAATTEEGGGAAQGDAAAGKEVFASAGCGGCHVLEAAGSSGTVGPNLDESKPSLELIVDNVTNGKGVMPSFKGQLSDQQIQDVAAFVFESTH